jgi:hypothetical protein
VPHATPQRPPRKALTFRITFTIGPDSYAVCPLQPHPDVATLAFRFRKQTGDRACYDVRLSPAGHIECDCPGFQRWRRPCKHVRTLAAARMLPASVLQPTPTPQGAALPSP